VFVWIVPSEVKVVATGHWWGGYMERFRMGSPVESESGQPNKDEKFF